VTLQELQQIVDEIHARTGLSPRQVYEAGEQDIFMPVALFANREFGIMEAVVKYLVENRGLRFAEIARMLNKDQRMIAVTYHNAKRKSIYIFREPTGKMVPVKVFQKKRGVLQALANYCHDKLGMTYAEIARLTGRDARNIWAVVNR